MSGCSTSDLSQRAAEPTAGQALIAAQFATVLQVVWRAIWQFLDAILLAA
jgi:hypothetical protein